MTCTALSPHAFAACSDRSTTFRELGVNAYEISMCGDMICRDVWICDQQTRFESDAEYIAALPDLIQEIAPTGPTIT